MTTEEFYKRISALPEKFENRNLEEYLLALYRLVENHQEESMTESLFFELIQQAFTSEPSAFRDEWLACENPPNNNVINRKFTSSEFKDKVDQSITTDLNELDFTKEVLKFQIAELHKMKGKQLESESRYFGINSETGNRWYNFDPFTNLECGAACLHDTADDDDDEIHFTWSTLGELLEDGRIYE